MFYINKETILKENTEFNRIINNIKPFRHPLFNLFYEPIDSDNYYFGFTVGKKIGKAVARNKIKRQLKNILQNIKFKKNFKCIIMVKKEILNKSYQEIEEQLLNLLKKHKIF